MIQITSDNTQFETGEKLLVIHLLLQIKRKKLLRDKSNDELHLL